MNTAFAPNGTNAFVAAVCWLDGVLAGTLASVIAVIAIASIGLFLLSGRVDVRRSLQVILGCFIIFGASTIAAGIVQSMTGLAKMDQQISSAPPPVYTAVPARVGPPSTPYDPYAGAALQPR